MLKRSWPQREPSPRVGVCALGAGWLVLCWLAVPAIAIDFVDVSASAGLDHVQHVAQAPGTCIFGAVCDPDRMTGGVASADVDGDGDLDLFFTRIDGHDLLYANDGLGVFTDISAGSGLADVVAQTNGAVFADIDNDGDSDLYVTTLGTSGDPANNRNYLFLNDGSGHFTEVAAARGAAVSDAAANRASFSVSAGDFDNDGWTDLHTVEWSSIGTASVLLRNLGPAQPGSFEDVSASSGTADIATSFGFASSFVDLDGDGWQDLAVAGDFGTSRLFWNDGDGTFTEGTVAAGVGTDENGMGSAFADFDRDGKLDWFVTSIHDANATCDSQNCGWGYTGNRLYRNLGGRVFEDATDAAGVREGFWGWGAAFADFDNDGDADLVMTNGVDFPGVSVDDAYTADPMRLWENDGTGQYAERSMTAGLTDTGSGKGLLPFDMDGDGDLDLLVVNNAAAPRLYRNESPTTNDWIAVEVEGAATNRDGRGVRVLVSRPGIPDQLAEIGADSHFLAGMPTRAHFGLGPNSGTTVAVEVTLPASGATYRFPRVAPNQVLVLHEPPPLPACGLGVELLPITGALWYARSRRRRRASTGTSPAS